MNLRKFTKTEIICLIFAFAFAISTAVLSICLFTKKDEAAEPSYYEEKCNVFELENTNFSHGQIVFIGDSITDGCALDSYYSDLPLATYNRGIGGDNTSGVLDRLKISLFDIKPSKIVLLIGVNDINGNRSKSEVINNYRNILSEISSNLPDTHVFCVSILPLNKSLENYTHINVEKSTEIILETNPEIEKLAREFDYTYVDVFSDFADESNLLIENLSVDGIHLNHNGYILYSQKLKPLLAQK